MNYLLANTLSISLAFTINWLGGRFFIFGNENSYLSEFTRLALLTSISFVAQMLVMVISVEILLINEYVSKILGLSASFVLNFYFRLKIYNINT